MTPPLSLTDISHLADPLWIERFNQDRINQQKSLPGIGVTVTTEDTSGTLAIQPVYHGLGRVPSSVVVTRADGSVTVTDARNVKAWDDKYVYLKFSAANIVTDLRII